MIYIINYDAGNIGSVVNTFNFIGEKVKLLNTPKKLSPKDIVVLPGVGSFEEGIKSLNKKGFSDFLIDWIKGGGRFLGICLGFQLLFSSSNESKNGKSVRGLGIFKNRVSPVPRKKTFKVPHMGWNNVSVLANPLYAKGGAKKRTGVFSNNKTNCFDFLENKFFYFVHSFCVKKESGDAFSFLLTSPSKKTKKDASLKKESFPKITHLLQTNYSTEMVVGIKGKNFLATQFHPEKSGEEGLALLNNWLKEIREEDKQKKGSKK